MLVSWFVDLGNNIVWNLFGGLSLFVMVLANGIIVVWASKQNKKLKSMIDHEN